MLNESQIITTTAAPTMTTLHKRSFLKLSVTSRSPVLTPSLSSKISDAAAPTWKLNFRIISCISIDDQRGVFVSTRNPAYSVARVIFCMFAVAEWTKINLPEFTSRATFLMLYLVGSCVSTCMAQGLLCSGQVSSMDGPTKSK